MRFYGTLRTLGIADPVACHTGVTGLVEVGQPHITESGWPMLVSVLEVTVPALQVGLDSACRYRSPSVTTVTSSEGVPSPLVL